MQRPTNSKTIEVVVIVLSIIVGVSLGLFGVREMQKNKERKAPAVEKPR